MEVIGYLSSMLIGISLGMIGGGGSTLTIPILVFIFGIDIIAATGYSLFVVGITSLVGSLKYYKDGLVNIKTGLIFGLTAILAVFITRLYHISSIPLELIRLESFVLTKSVFMLLLFAILMLFSAIKMNW